MSKLKRIIPKSLWNEIYLLRNKLLAKKNNRITRAIKYIN